MVTSPDLTKAVTEILEHANDYRLADRYYKGAVDEVFASDKIAAMLKASARHYRCNLAATPVDAVLNGLELSTVMVPSGQDGKPNEQLTKILQTEIIESNELSLYLPDWFREVGKEGDAYLIVWDGEESESGQSTCEVHICKPVGARMFYQEENPREKDFFAKMWREHRTKLTRINLYYADRVERYVSTSKEPKSDKDFQQFVDDVSPEWPIPHAYEEVPVFHGRTDHPYGVPDHFKAYGPQNAITKLLATHMSSIDFQGFPLRAALMDPTLDDDGDAWDQDDNEATAGSGQIDMDDESRLAVSPGRLWTLRNVKALIQLEAADPDVFLKPLDKSVQLMSAATGTPLRFFTGTQGQQPSGASLREDDKRLTDRKEMRHRMLGATLSDALTFAMRRILGHKDCPRVVVDWAPAQRAELLDEWQTVSAKQEAGVPRDTSLQEAGYTATQIEEWAGTTPDPAAGLADRVALLNQLGDAAQKLATAAELGAIDMALVQQLMAGFLPAPEDMEGVPAPPAPPEEGPSPTLREQAEMVQKIYLGVPNVLSREEARALLAEAGIPIDPDAPAPSTE